MFSNLIADIRYSLRGFAKRPMAAVVVFGAGYFPARRASRVDPIIALRYE